MTRSRREFGSSTATAAEPFLDPADEPWIDYDVEGDFSIEDRLAASVITGVYSSTGALATASGRSRRFFQ